MFIFNSGGPPSSASLGNANQFVCALAVLLSYAAPVAAQDESAGEAGIEAAPAESEAVAPPIEEPPTADDGDDSEAPAAAEDSMLTVRVSVGAGRVEEAKAADQSAYAGFMAGLDAYPAAGLYLSLEAGADYYDRRYLTNSATSARGGLLAVSEREHRVRGDLRIGYDLLDAADISRRDATLNLYLMGALDMYVNDPLPETLFSVGGGLALQVAIADQLRLSTDLHYAYAVTNDHQDVQDALLYGPIKGVLGYGGGLWLVLPPHALIGVTYRGEWIANDNSRRFVNGAELTLGFEL